MLEKHYDHKIVEQGKYKNWKEKGYFTSGDISKQKFSMVIPPPNVTGKLHMGHAFNTTIQDIIARYKKACGYDVLWLPGMDHAGIATQAKVEAMLREKGISRYDLGREGLINEIWKWKNSFAEKIHEQWEKMGLMLDYTKESFTLDENLSKAVNHVFKVMYDEGLIYQGERIINWDPVQQTALSNIEVIHKNIKGEFYYFKYKVVDSNDELIVATTRPETMFGDVCLNVNPKDERYKKFIGKKAINPANNEELPIIADSYVDISFGTGVMKCTPAHDPNDYVIGKKYNLPHPICINKDGTMNELAGEFNHLDRFECRKKLVKKIKNEGNLVKIEKITHSVGHSERSNAIVEPYLSKQWFIKMKPLAEKSIKYQAGKDKVEFIPSRFNKVFLQWMENIDDWCISRQLWWGHRIPVYYHKISGEILVSENPPKDIENYRQDEDVLDTWFSSALWPFSTLGWPENTEMYKRYFPTDLLVTAYDIIFFWVSRMINQSLNLTGKKPFDKVLIHGLIRDANGKKMSKSLNNGIDPIDVIDKFGVDAFRYYLATSTTPGLDTRYNEIKIESSVNFLNKIWNAARYILLNVENIKVNEINLDKLDIFDKYILTKLQDTINNVTKNMEKYNLGTASTNLYNFIYEDFCSFYIETCKYYFKNSKIEIIDNKKAILLYGLKSIIMMIYPYSPFISEELYLNLPEHKESIMLESYPIVNKKFIFKNVKKDVELLRNVIADIRSYKTNNKLNQNDKISLRITTDLNLDCDFYNILKDFIKCDDFIIDNTAYKATSLIYPNFIVYVLDSFDKAQRLEKLKAELASEEFEIQRCENLLKNEKFVSKAPKEKVELEREKLKNHLEIKAKILEKIENL